MSSKKNNFIFFEELISDRIIIREFQYKDMDDLFELFSNSNVTKYLSFDSYSEHMQAQILIDAARVQYTNNEIFYLGIESIEKHKIIGYIGLSRFDLTPSTCQVVYALNEDYWGCGYMVEALGIFIKYLIDVQKKKKIIATHIDINKNSGRVMQKAGMLRDIFYDQNMIIKGKTEKLIGYSIIKE